MIGWAGWLSYDWDGWIQAGDAWSMMLHDVMMITTLYSSMTQLKSHKHADTINLRGSAIARCVSQIDST